MLPNGELLITNLTWQDASKEYRCITRNKLTEQKVISSNAGRIILADIQNQNDLIEPIMNEQLLNVRAKINELIIIPCVAYGYPKPIYR